MNSIDVIIEAIASSDLDCSSWDPDIQAELAEFILEMLERKNFRIEKAWGKEDGR